MYIRIPGTRNHLEDLLHLVLSVDDKLYIVTGVAKEGGSTTLELVDYAAYIDKVKIPSCEELREK